MAIFHLSVSSVNRTSGRSAVASAAYRAATRLLDGRTGEVSDYRRKRGVVTSFIAAPTTAPAWAVDRQALWTAAEQAESRRNSTTAREWRVALPAELDGDTRTALTRDLAVKLAERFGVAVDASIHLPDRSGDERNHHAHLLTTTRKVGPDGLGEKTRELDVKATSSAHIEEMRAWWAEQCNTALAAAGERARIDHRSHAAQRADLTISADTLMAEAAREERRIVRRDGNDEVADRIEQRRKRAAALRKRAERIPQQPTTHQGPARTALKRKQARIEAAQRAAVDRRARQERYQQALAAQRQVAEQERIAAKREEQRLALEKKFEAIADKLAATLPVPGQPFDYSRTPPNKYHLARNLTGLFQLDDGHIADWKPTESEIDQWWKRTIGTWFRRIADALSNAPRAFLDGLRSIGQLMPEKGGWREFIEREGKTQTLGENGLDGLLRWAEEQRQRHSVKAGWVDGNGEFRTTADFPSPAPDEDNEDDYDNSGPARS